MKLPSIRTDRAALAKAAEDAFSGSYAEYQYIFVDFLVEHLTDISRGFRGDLQQMLILAVIGQTKIGAVRRAIEAGEDPGRAVLIRFGISATRLADVTALPRQTVRRKLAILRDKGWVDQDPDATWHIRIVDGEVPARNDLGGMDSRAVRRIARLYAELNQIIATHVA